MPSLAADLKNIRRDHKLSIQDMYELTRIPVDTLKAIEDGTLFDDESRNPTYTRSFVRTYARALKISESDIVRALDDHIIGVYNGFLADKYGSGTSGTDKDSKESEGKPSSQKEYGSRFKLDIPEEEAESGKTEGESKEQESEEESEDLAKEEEAAFLGERIEQKSNDQQDTENTEGEEEDEGLDNNQSTSNRGIFSVPDPDKPYNQKVPEPPSVKSVDWASVGKRTYSLGRRPWILLMILLIIIVFAGVTLIVVKRMSQTNTSNGAGGIETVDSLATPPLMTREDSVKAGLLPPVSKKPALPDTLKVVVYAAFGPLSPVRVQTDLYRKMNPYWIDEGEGMRFAFQDSINIKGIFNNMILLYNGHPLANYRNYVRSNDVLHLERSYFKGHPQWQTASHDTLPGGVPQPQVVRNQPLY